MIKNQYSCDHIKFLGSKTHDQVEKWLETIDIICVPSLCQETGPMVVMEALHNGIPVIGSNFGGIKELITHNYNGILFNPFNQESIHNSFNLLNKEKIDILKTNCQFNRSFENVALDHIKLYENLKEKI